MLFRSATIAATVRNAGDSIVGTRTTYAFTSISPLALLPGSDERGTQFYKLTTLAHTLLPGQALRDEASSVMAEGDAQGADLLPFIGFVRVRATTEGGIGGLSTDPVTQTVTFLIVPWKEALALLLLWAAWRLIRRRWRKRRGRSRRPTVPAGPTTEPVAPTTEPGPG